MVKESNDYTKLYAGKGLNCGRCVNKTTVGFNSVKLIGPRDDIPTICAINIIVSSLLNNQSPIGWFFFPPPSQLFDWLLNPPNLL